MNKAYLTGTQVELIYEVIKKWYGDGYPDYSPELRRAIARTAEQGLFNEADIHHSLKAHFEAIDKPTLKKWVENGISGTDGGGASLSVLCLHAGNFPLAGFQNALGVLLSGAEYWGKLSSKDPWLLDSFLQLASGYELPNLRLWSTELGDLELAGPVHAVLFAGDRESVAPLRAELEDQKKTDTRTKFLVRTTHYSVAYLQEINEKVLDQLTEAMLRYEGLGCRSVAAVVAPQSLVDCRQELQNKMKAFLEELPPKHIQGTYAAYQKAYNHAREVSQLYAPPFLLQEAVESTVREGLVFWIPGGVEKLRDFITERRYEIQTIYSDRPDALQAELKMEQPVELLSKAQTPSIDWRPDGVDTIEWIWNNLVH